MKKIILLLTVCFGFMANSFAQSGDVMTATHNVYSGITHTYSATGTDDFTWEVFSDEDCTAALVDGTVYDFTTASNLNDLGITWNDAGTYYLRLKQDDGCINYKTLKVMVTPVGNMTFAFAATATTDGCAVNISGSPLRLDVTLTGDYLIHEPGKQARVQYAVGTDAPKWLNINLGATAADKGAGTYTIVIPAIELFSAVVTTSQEFKINIYQLEDGNGAVNNFTGSPVIHTWTANPLPVVEDISF